jgi:hypothetical protein
MTISIGGITLSDDLIWENEFDYPEVAQSARTLLGGGTWVQSTALSKRPEIKLSAIGSGTSFSGYFTYTQLGSLKSIERSQAVVNFVYGSVTKSVVIQANGIDVQPVLPRPDTEGSDMYIGTITMIEV